MSELYLDIALTVIWDPGKSRSKSRSIWPMSELELDICKKNLNM